jgi:hypothetical protein
LSSEFVEAQRISKIWPSHEYGTGVEHNPKKPQHCPGPGKMEKTPRKTLTEHPTTVAPDLAGHFLAPSL